MIKKKSEPYAPQWLAELEKENQQLKQRVIELSGEYRAEGIFNLEKEIQELTQRLSDEGRALRQSQDIANEALRENGELKAEIKTIQQQHADFLATSESDLNKLQSVNAELLEALKEATALLDEHEPQWYLKGHHNRFTKAISKAEGK